MQLYTNKSIKWKINVSGIKQSNETRHWRTHLKFICTLKTKQVAQLWQRNRTSSIDDFRGGWMWGFILGYMVMFRAIKTLHLVTKINNNNNHHHHHHHHMYICIPPYCRNFRGGTCHSLKRTQADPWEINLIAYLPLVQPPESPCPDLDLNSGHQPARPSRHCGSDSILANWATETDV